VRSERKTPLRSNKGGKRTKKRFSDAKRRPARTQRKRGVREGGRMMPPTSYAKSSSFSEPRYKRGKDNIEISHREYLFDLNGSNLFEAVEHIVTPLSNSLFPWLSKEAVNWQTYKFKKLCFSYEPTVGTDTAGAVMLGYLYDNDEVIPATKAEMLNDASTVKTPAWMPDCFEVDIDRVNILGERYVSELPGNEDAFTEAGKLILAASNAASTLFVGEVYVDYIIELALPIAAALAIELQSAHIQCIPTSALWFNDVDNILNIDGDHIFRTPSGATLPLEFRNVGVNNGVPYPETYIRILRAGKYLVNWIMGCSDIVNSGGSGTDIAILDSPNNNSDDIGFEPIFGHSTGAWSATGNVAYGTFILDMRTDEGMFRFDMTNLQANITGAAKMVNFSLMIQPTSYAMQEATTVEVTTSSKTVTATPPATEEKKESSLPKGLTWSIDKATGFAQLRGPAQLQRAFLESCSTSQRSESKTAN